MRILFTALIAAVLAWAPECWAQGTVPGQYMIPLGFCQITTALSSAVKLSSCTWATFTGTGSGTSMKATSVAGVVAIGETISGTGVPSGTTITGQTSGAPGGVGTYTTSLATTSSSQTISVSGTPTLPSLMLTLQAETAGVRYRDDGVAPTASVGALIVNGFNPMLYTGTLANIQFIAASGSPVLDIGMYRQ
jgi:hypothetical protein